MVFEICRSKNGFREKLTPQNSDFGNCFHILITNEQLVKLVKKPSSSANCTSTSTDNNNFSNEELN
jgi:hypothetical protein